MKYLINNIKLNLYDDHDLLKNVVAKKLNISRDDLLDFRILKESVDARRKSDIKFMYSVSVRIDSDKMAVNADDVKILEELKEDPLITGDRVIDNRPLIIGSGPSGLFAGLVLARAGFRPIIFERGESMENRIKCVNTYWESGILDESTNVQFGEGGAGTFSDGKLTTRISDVRCEYVLKELNNCGAPDEILYKAKPHIGTDILKNVVVNMRNKILEYGGEIRFNSKITDFIIEGGKIKGVCVNDGDIIRSNVVVLAIGHSARDTFYKLFETGLEITRKPFSIGVRIEHPKELIDFAQFGREAGNPRLGASEYQLSHRVSNRSVYTFCMCPGGRVVASASEPGTIVTNGMSEFARDFENSNSAVVVSVDPEDFGGMHPLAGVEFQRKWEKAAYMAGGGMGEAPVQTLGDFLKDKNSGKLGAVRPSYTGDFKVTDINSCLPDFVSDTIKSSIGYFDNKLRGFGKEDAVLTGVETRTSSPVRILRNENFESVNTGGLYPTGEGAGYAGGIVSAAVDGIKVAERIVRTFAIP